MFSPHKNESRDSGRIAMPMFVSFIAVLALVTLFDVARDGGTHSVQATSTATTTVTVLNTPPSWDIYAYEYYESSIANPTNSGTSTVWAARAVDNNSEQWWLLVCRSSSTPNALLGGPTCGNSDPWTRGGPFASGVLGTTSTTTVESAPFAESNAWYAYICDDNGGIGGGSPRCNGVMWNGDGSATSSPFIMNRRPTITNATNTAPVLPGGVIQWNTLADDPDSVGGEDTLVLHVCRAFNDFVPSTPTCGVGGYWASSTLAVTANPYASTTIDIPAQDGNRNAYIYIVDQHNHFSTSTWYGSSSIFYIDNVAPTVSTSSIGLFDVFGTSSNDTNLNLTVPEGETQNFVVEFQVNDDNSCLSATPGDEITQVDINVYRSAIGFGSCLLDTDYNANHCYTYASPNWAPNCYQVPGSCTGADDINAEWECTFPLWFIADPTDAGSQYAGETWNVSARAQDEALTGNYSASTTNAEMIQFLSFRATGSPIAYGSFEPGFGNTNHPATTTVYATGNTGLDTWLSGDGMCPSYPNCSGLATSTIFIAYQHYATTSSGATYGLPSVSASTTASSSPVLVDVDIRKPQATTTPTNCTIAAQSCDETYWGIFVPGTILLAGDYIGRNYIEADIAPSTEW